MCTNIFYEWKRGDILSIYIDISYFIKSLDIFIQKMCIFWIRHLLNIVTMGSRICGWHHFSKRKMQPIHIFVELSSFIACIDLWSSSYSSYLLNTFWSHNFLKFLWAIEREIKLKASNFPNNPFISHFQRKESSFFNPRWLHFIYNLYS